MRDKPVVTILCLESLHSPKVDASADVFQTQGHFLREEISKMIVDVIVKKANLPRVVVSKKRSQKVRFVPIPSLEKPGFKVFE
jgi:hypothetical protein